MRQWTQNKPRGFGEGKVYDTKLEDKLLEELEQSRVAQLANINNLKNNPQLGNPNLKNQKISKHKGFVFTNLLLIACEICYFLELHDFILRM